MWSYRPYSEVLEDPTTWWAWSLIAPVVVAVVLANVRWWGIKLRDVIALRQMRRDLERRRKGNH